MIDINALVGPVASALCAFAGSWLAFSTRLTRVETKLESIEAKQDKHNNLIERMALVEQDDKAQWRRIDEVRGEMETIRRELQ